MYKVKFVFSFILEAFTIESIIHTRRNIKMGRKDFPKKSWEVFEDLKNILDAHLKAGGGELEKTIVIEASDLKLAASGKKLEMHKLL